MATTSVQTRLRLALHARALLYVAAMLARLGIRIPHKWVVAVTNRSWSMEIGYDVWQRIRIDGTGRVIK